MRVAAILLAAGRGERLGDARHKAFVDLAGSTLLERAIDTVERCPEIQLLVVALPSGGGDVRSSKPFQVVAGGATRQASVAAALEALPGDVETVVCHDVARPLATPHVFAEVLAAVRGAEGAIPVVPVVDTIKRVAEGLVAETLPREDLVAAQTPQAFRRSALQDAHRRAAEDDVEATDDAALLERIGGTIVTVPGDPSNLKVTRSEDLLLAELLLRRHG